MTGRYGVGEAAAILGVSVETLRFWERSVGIPAPRRSRGGHRRYDDEDLALARRFLDLTRRHGYSLEDARRMVAAGPHRPESPGTRTLRSLATITHALADAEGLAVLLHRVCQAVQDALLVDRAIVYLRTGDGERLRRIYRSERSRRPSEIELEIEVGVGGGLRRALEQGRPVLVHRDVAGPGGLVRMQETGVVSGLAIPLVLRGHATGLIFADTPRQDRRFSADEVLVAGMLGDCTAVALEMARLRAAGQVSAPGHGSGQGENATG